MVGPICSIDVSPGGRLVDIEPKPESRSSSVGCTKTRRICEFFLICVLMCTVIIFFWITTVRDAFYFYL